jgi:hypothetical protein
MANDLSAFNSEAWSDRLVTKLDQINVMLPLVNRNWEGDLRLNKTVWIRTPGNIAMAPYTRGTQISYQDLTPAKEAFTVNDGEYFAFEVDDIDKAQSDINAMDVYMKRAVVAMNNTVEAKLLSSYVFTPGANQITAGTTGAPNAAGSGATATCTLSGSGLPGTSTQVGAIALTSGGSGYAVPPVVQITPAPGDFGWGATATATISGGAVTAITLTNPGANYKVAPTIKIVPADPISLTSDTSPSTGIYQLFQDVRQIHSNNNVPRDGRWAIVDPYTASAIMEDTTHFVRAGELGDLIVQSALIGGDDVARTAVEAPGFIGMIAGYAVYETPHVPVDPADGSRYLLFGDPEAISYAAQITEIEALRLQNTFANAVRGLLLHDIFVPMEASKRLVTIKVAPAN